MSYLYRQETSEVELARLLYLPIDYYIKELDSFRLDDYAEYFQNINNSRSSWFHGRKLLPFTIMIEISQLEMVCVRRACNTIDDGRPEEYGHNDWLLSWFQSLIAYLEIRFPALGNATFGLSMARNSRSSIEQTAAELVQARVSLILARIYRTNDTQTQ